MEVKSYNLVVNKNVTINGVQYEEGEILYHRLNKEDVLRFIGEDSFRIEGFCGHIDEGKNGFISFALKKELYLNIDIIEVTDIIETKTKKVNKNYIINLFPHLNLI